MMTKKQTVLTAFFTSLFASIVRTLLQRSLGETGMAQITGGIYYFAILFVMMNVVLFPVYFQQKKQIEKATQECADPQNPSEDDVIRLANEGKRKTAALIYSKLRKVYPAKAERRVGIPPGATVFILIELTMVILGISSAIHFENMSPTNGFVLFLAVILFFSLPVSFCFGRWKARRNRRKIAEGRLP